jgi:hypothetical protein
MNRMNLILISLSLACFPASADEIPSDKKAAIQELIQITGAGQIGDQVTELFTRQMIEALRADYPDLPGPMIQAIREEVALVVNEEIEQGTLQKTIYPIYAKHFTLEEIQGLIDFNRSALGRKANKLMPQLMSESSQAAQQWGLGLRVKLIERVSETLKAKGLNILADPQPEQ